MEFLQNFLKSSFLLNTINPVYGVSAGQVSSFCARYFSCYALKPGIRRIVLLTPATKELYAVITSKLYRTISIHRKFP